MKANIRLNERMNDISLQGKTGIYQRMTKSKNKREKQRDRSASLDNVYHIEQQHMKKIIRSLHKSTTQIMQLNTYVRRGPITINTFQMDYDYIFLQLYELSDYFSSYICTHFTGFGIISTSAII